jgi:hypothetical protein
MRETDFSARRIPDLVMIDHWFVLSPGKSTEQLIWSQ